MADPDEPDYGLVDSGQSSIQVVTVTNLGPDSVTIDELVLLRVDESQPSGPQLFELHDNTTCAPGLTMLPGSACVVWVQFTAPQGFAGDYAAGLLVVGGPNDFDALSLLHARSVLPGALSPSVASIDFGAVRSGQSAPSRMVAIRNTGGRAVRNLRVSPVGGVFEVLSPKCPSILEPGHECAVTVVYRPKNRTATAETALATGHLYVSGSNFGIPPSNVSGIVGLRATLVSATGEPFPTLSDRRAAVRKSLRRIVDSVPRSIRGGPTRRLRLPVFKAPGRGPFRFEVRGFEKEKRVLLTKVVGGADLDRARRFAFKLSRAGRRVLTNGRATTVSVSASFRDTEARNTLISVTRKLVVKSPAVNKQSG